jgi:superkiller protein 3
MSEYSIKDCLKGARESIDKKDYKEALEWSEKAIKVDDTNYNAYVFKGVAAANLDKVQDSENAYLFKRSLLDLSYLILLS